MGRQWWFALACAWLASGCSGSGDGDAPDEQSKGVEGSAGGPAKAPSDPLRLEVDAPPPFLTGDAGQLRLTARLRGDASVLPKAFELRWAVADREGKELRVMLANSDPLLPPNGTQSVLWDGRDAAGERVPAGQYSLSVELIGEDATSKEAPLEVLPASVDSDIVCTAVGQGAHNPATLQPELSIVGTDLGIPVELGGRMYLMFGDTWTRAVCEGTDEPYASLRRDDVLAWMELDPEPDPNGCLGIEFPVLEDDPSKFAPLMLEEEAGETIDLLALGAPSVGFRYRDRLYAIFNPYGKIRCDNDFGCPAKSTCSLGVCVYRAQPAYPPRIIAAATMVDGQPTSEFSGIAQFDDIDFSNIAGRTVNRIDDGGDDHDYGNDAPSELLLFGRHNYLAGVDDKGNSFPPDLYLLRQPLAPLVDEGRFAPQYFAGFTEAGGPRWTADRAEAAPIVGQESEVAAGEGQDQDPSLAPGPIMFPGNMAVSTIPPFGAQGFRWLMVYGGRAPLPVDFFNTDYDPRVGIFFRLARDPWGPWTPPRRLWSVYSPEGPSVVFRPDMDSVPSDPGRALRNCDVDEPYADIGVEYSPQVLERWSTVDGNQLTLHWFMSVWNPYRVIQMKTVIAAE